MRKGPISKHEETIFCIRCGKKFVRRKFALNRCLGVGVRPSGTVTCSRECARSKSHG